MAYDEGLAHRVEDLIGEEPGIETRKMFGGIGFLLDGNMVCGILDENLIARVGPDAYAEALKDEHAHEFDFTGRPMKGWVSVDPEGIADDEQFERWVRAAQVFAATLPAK